MKELGYAIGQTYHHIQIGPDCNLKIIERYFSGVLFCGYWSLINAPTNPEVLSIIACQINNARKALLENVTNTQINKVNINLNPNVAFFLNYTSFSSEAAILSTFNQKTYRSITMFKPNL